MFTGEVVAREGWTPEKKKHLWKFSQAMADVICTRLLEGEALTKICAAPGFPSYGVVSEWRRRYPDFSDQVEQAISDRSEVYHDQIMRIVEDLNKTGEKDFVQASRVQIEALKWAAEVGNKARFGKKDTIGGNVAVQLIINTGIDRSEGLLIGPAVATSGEDTVVLEQGGSLATQSKDD